jgi:hypothetical protein
MEDINLEAERTCPYCHEVMSTRPYWAHIAAEHPDEYANSQNTWYPLYLDYDLAGMSIEQILMVLTELFNAKSNDVKTFLIHESYNEKIRNGIDQSTAAADVAGKFGIKVAAVQKLVGK